MKELTILSGKGGTGKTSVTAALASLAGKLVYCDNDVDAPDLHLIFDPVILHETQFMGAWVASINPELCNNCGICAEHCRFDAIAFNGDQHEVNPYHCEGCRLCEKVCPTGAATTEQSTKNNWYHSSTRFGPLFHARMAPGEENSGKLVALLREKAKEQAQKEGFQLLINDGPPGTGCTAISSVTGSDHVLLVIEPSLSGVHDAKRVIELVNGFNIPLSAIINKYDINETISSEIEHFLQNEKINYLGKLPFTSEVVKAMMQRQTIIEFAPEAPISRELDSIWKKLKAILQN